MALHFTLGGSTSTKWFFVYLIPGRTRGKTSRRKGENQQQTQPTYGVDAEI